MFKNYYLFSQLLEEIKPALTGQTVVRVFTYRKNEISIEFKNEYLLLLGISSNEPYILLKENKKINQPQFELFQQINGNSIKNIHLKKFDKHLVLDLETHRLEAIFFPPHNNVFLFSEANELLDLFKEKNEYPQTESPPEPKMDLREVQKTTLNELLTQSNNLGVLQFLKKHFAALSKTMTDEILFRCQLSSTTKLAELTQSQKKEFTGTLLQVGRQLSAGKAYLYFDNASNQVEKISLIPLHHLETGCNVREFDSINHALATFYYERRVRQEFEKLKAISQTALQKRLKFLKSSLQRVQQNADLSKRKAEAELKGNLLLTFKNQIPVGAKEVELTNIFSDEQKKIKIKLNPAKSVSANAQRYFNKFKNIKHDRQVLQIKMDTYQKEIEEIEQLLTQLEQIKTLQRLKTFNERLKEMRLIQDSASTKKEFSGDNLKYAFNRLILDGRWDVYIGKDGQTNDLLTFGFANKWDIWLHAQGVPGAHVIIRVPNRTQTPPAHVIEQAARIAAAHSKARNSATVPVIYTQVRYVSRIRKTPPGTVKVQNEKVLFVQPMNIN